MKVRLCVGLALLAWAMGEVSAATLETGNEIVIPSGNGGVERALKEAADTLARVFREGTGGDLRVVTLKEHKPSAKAVFLGAEAAKRAGFDLSGFKAMENVIAEKDGDIYLFGVDRPGRKFASVWYQCLLPSVRALTRFMEGRMDVRFLMPGDVGIDVPKIGRVELPEGTFDRELPNLEIGNGRNCSMMYDIANNMFGCGASFTYGGHTYPSACPVDKYLADHPEYFSLRAGKRTSQRGTSALCISNPAVEDLVVAEVLRRFDEGSDIVELGQNDGLDYCECEKCAALGKGLGYGEQFWVFHRRVAERLYKLRPEKKVLITAYSVTSDPPKSFKGFPPNVMVEIMLYALDDFAKWDAFGVPNGYTVYIYLWGEYQRPGLTAKRTFAGVAETARKLIKSGTKGVYRCGYGELFGTEGPAYYVFNRLLGDITLNEDRLVGEFCRRAYGPAAKPMMSFFRILDQGLASVQIPSERAAGYGYTIANPMDLHSVVYSPSALSAMEGFLTAAERLAETDKQRKRIALTRLEFKYATFIARIVHLYRAYVLSPTRESFEPLADAVLARNAFIDSLYDANGRIKSPIAGWPEVAVLGKFGKPMMMTNGRLGATLSSPFVWDVATMREKGVLPGKDVKSLDITRTASKPTLADFKADRAGWANAAWNELGGMSLQQVSDRTRFKVLYDKENVYFGIETTLDDSVKVSPCGADGKPWLQDCLEVMVDPTGMATRWYHLMINAAPDSFADAACGLIDDPLDPKYGQSDQSWNGKWSYEVDRSNGLWRLFVTLPFATLGTECPVVGETWKINVGRESGDNGAGGLSLWNPNFESRQFTSPAAYGKAVFR